jgi:hypothetical protein
MLWGGPPEPPLTWVCPQDQAAIPSDSSSCASFVPMVQPADLRPLDHRTQFCRLNDALLRSVLGQRKMRARTTVQVDNQIPIVRSRERSVIRGIRGVGVRSGFTGKL